MKTMNMLILVANSAEAKIFVAKNLRIGELELLQEIQHPESKKRVSDLITDKPGHYKTDTGMRGSYSEADHKEHVVEEFVIELFNVLKSLWKEGKYENLALIVPSHFYGILNKHIGSHDFGKNEIVHVLKDYTKYSTKQLLESLQEHLVV